MAIVECRRASLFCHPYLLLDSDMQTPCLPQPMPRSIAGRGPGLAGSCRGQGQQGVAQGQQGAAFTLTKAERGSAPGPRIQKKFEIEL